MFNFFRSKPEGKSITLKLDGLHCTSCSLNIDGSLEELKGVISSKTSYAKQETNITFDPNQVKKEQFVKIIKDLGYNVQ